MRKWGVVISAFYALFVVGFLVPIAVLLVGPSEWGGFSQALRGAYGDSFTWFPISVVLGGQALLLFLSVDTSQKRLKPRAHVLLSCTVGGILTALLAFAIVFSLGVGIRGDKFGGSFFNERSHLVGFWALLWLFWGIAFYLYLRNASAAVTRIISWLLKGASWSCSSLCHATL